MFFTETVAVIRHQNRSLCLLERYLNDNDYHLQQYFPAAIERRASARFAREPDLDPIGTPVGALGVTAPPLAR